MLDTLDVEEYAEVMHAATKLPLPERRADMRAAMIALIVARSAGNSAVQFDDLLPNYGAANDEEQDEDEIDRQMTILAAKVAAVKKDGN